MRRQRTLQIRMCIIPNTHHVVLVYICYTCHIMITRPSEVRLQRIRHIVVRSTVLQHLHVIILLLLLLLREMEKLYR